MKRYAEGTGTSPARSLEEIEKIVKRFGASRFGFAIIEEKSAVSFVAGGRIVRFTIPMPSPDDKEVKKRALALSRSNWRIDPPKLEIAIEEEKRRRWRCMVLAIKSKFTIVESGIETFEQAFLANIVTDDNITIWERLQQQDSGIRLLAPMEGKT
jgi:hypothetical protein